MFCFAVSATEAKQLLRTLAISHGLVVVFTPWESVLGTVDMTFFIVNGFNALPYIFWIVQVRLKICFIVILFTYFFSKGLKISFYDFCILNEVLLEWYDRILFLMKSERNLFFTEGPFWGPAGWIKNDKNTYFHTNHLTPDSVFPKKEILKSHNVIFYWN